MLVATLREAGVDVAAIRRGDGGFDARDRSSLESLPSAQVVFNCVGDIARGASDPESFARMLETNAVFPRRVATLAATYGARVVHISSDGVFAGREAPYLEGESPDAGDDYGASKRLGEVVADHVLNVRLSIVGPETTPRGHLLENFLARADGEPFDGFDDQIWDGATTLQASRLCLEMVEPERFDEIRARSAWLHFAPNEPLSKHALLVEINRAYGRAIEVRQIQSGQPRTRILESQFRGEIPGLGKRAPIRAALEAMREHTRVGSAR